MPQSVGTDLKEKRGESEILGSSSPSQVLGASSQEHEEKKIKAWSMSASGKGNNVREIVFQCSGVVGSGTNYPIPPGFHPNCMLYRKVCCVCSRIFLPSSVVRVKFEALLSENRKMFSRTAHVSTECTQAHAHQLGEEARSLGRRIVGLRQFPA